jgi:hypothetical protein
MSGRVGSPNLLTLANVIAASLYRTQGGDFSRIDFHRTNYGGHEPLNDAVWQLMRLLVCSIFKGFIFRLKSVL